MEFRCLLLIHIHGSYPGECKSPPPTSRGDPHCHLRDPFNPQCGVTQLEKLFWRLGRGRGANEVKIKVETFKEQEVVSNPFGMTGNSTEPAVRGGEEEEEEVERSIVSQHQIGEGESVCECMCVCM